MWVTTAKASGSPVLHRVPARPIPGDAAQCWLALGIRSIFQVLARLFTRAYGITPKTSVKKATCQPPPSLIFVCVSLRTHRRCIGLSLHTRCWVHSRKERNAALDRERRPLLINELKAPIYEDDEEGDAGSKKAGADKGGNGKKGGKGKKDEVVQREGSTFEGILKKLSLVWDCLW